ncbi:hypothetical protein HA466_0226410 [Hirschfeldia incana]|nr:hypothetical protein HA466_0226410 [Hirschfeldia incana]
MECDSSDLNVSRQKKQRTEDKTLSAMLDLGLLDCPICVEPLSIPIFQCDNGHLACSSCCPKLKNKCPSCALPVGHSRCRAMETVLKSVSPPMPKRQIWMEPFGVYVTVSCIAPSIPEVGQFSYYLTYTVDGQSITYKSSKMKKIREVSLQTPQDNYMLIPHSFLRGETLEMRLRIKMLNEEQQS